MHIVERVLQALASGIHRCPNNTFREEPDHDPSVDGRCCGNRHPGALANHLRAASAPFGTPQEARAMLDKAVAAVGANPAVALAMFNKGESGFVDRDLNTFCFRIADGKLLASPRAVPAGADVRTLKDPTGKNFGVELYAAAQGSDGQIAEVGPYLFPKPGTTEPVVPKVSFLARVGELGCGVGYYK